MDITSIIILFVIIGVIRLVNSSVVDSISVMSDPERTLEVVSEIKDLAYTKKIESYKKWLESREFIPDINFLSHSINDDHPMKCSAWWSNNDKTWALVYYAKDKINYDFVTTYNDRISVTTASTKDAIMLPTANGDYTQSFTNLPFHKLYKKHLEARRIVERRHSVTLPEQKPELIQVLIRQLITHTNHIMDLPIWKHMGVYWYFIRRNLNVNKSIK